MVWWLLFLSVAVLMLFIMLCKLYRLMSYSLSQTEHLKKELEPRLRQIEDRLHFVGLPEDVGDVVELRRLLWLGLNNMMDEQDEANWWKRGEEQ